MGGARSLVKKLEACLQPGDEILGPAECPISILNKNYRVHIMLVVNHISRLQAAVPRILKETKLAAEIYVEIDVDPQSML